jgi:PAS domain S-box-containing protein
LPPKKTDTNFLPQSIEEFKESEATLRAVFETSAVGIGIMGLDHKIIDANPSLCKMFGRTRHEFIGLSPEVATFPEDYPKSTEKFRELLDGKCESYTDERRYIRTDGEVFWAHITMSIVRDETGLPLFMVGMVIDINDQRRAMLDLRESETRFRAMFESSAVGLVILDVNTLVARTNNAARSMLDEPDLEKKLNNIYDFLNDRYRLAEHDLFEQILNGERDSYGAERRYQRPDGEEKWAKVTISAIRGSDKQLYSIVAILDEITEQKKIQEKLSQSEARFRAMFENTSVGIALTTFDRRILQVNDAAARITGYSSEELLTMNPFDLALPEYRTIAQDTLQELMDGKRDSMFVERRYRRKNGDIFWGRVTYSLVRGPDRQPQYLIGLIEDINEQKLAAENLAAQEAENLRMLAKRVEARTHELNETNLRLVNEIEQRQKAEEALAAKAAEEAIAAERSRLARDLHDAVTQTLFSASLIAEVLPEMWAVDEVEARNSTEELRQLTRGALAEMRTLLLELRPAALTQARFSDLVKQLSEAVIGRSRLPVRLNVSGNYEMPSAVKVAFYRIAQESLNNIVKYARASEVEITLQLERGKVQMQIKDNGIGFDLSSIKPTSLGTRIMHERAETIHANLNLSSHPGQGTVVSLEWRGDE